MATPQPKAPFPQDLGRFLVLERLGAGGMGAVYRARDKTLEREVALKFPHAREVAGERGRKRFLEEARAAARLDHPSFCRILDIVDDADCPFLVLAYIPGRSVPNGVLGTPTEAAELAHKVALALAEAHRRGVVHRDLKPSNILLLANGQPVITDFGLALRIDARSAEPPGEDEFLGTAAYMPPEQIDPDAGPVTAAADVYALGSVLYEMLCGRTPFVADSLPNLTFQVLVTEPEPPSRHRPGLHPTLDGICLRALAKQPVDRFADMTEFAGALEDYLLSHDPVRSQPTTVTAHGPLPRVESSAARFVFVGYGTAAPDNLAGQDRLFLDVGNQLVPGVVDHHQLCGLSSSTTLVLTRPGLIAAAARQGRRSDDPFTIVLHEHPDLDAVSSAFLALQLLDKHQYPTGASSLAAYVDRIDAGYPGLSREQPFTLYAAFLRLADRHHGRPGVAHEEGWRGLVVDGLRLIGWALVEQAKSGGSLTVLDAFACPGLFTEEDRQIVLADESRYRRKLADPHCAARRARLQLPGRFGGTTEVAALLIRDVDLREDPEHCVYFKNWARGDERLAGPPGFTALSVFTSEGPGRVRRAVLSVAPGRGVSLRGLGVELERAESECRRRLYGVDDRVSDPATGAARTPRPGYDNADPWYDGRGHAYTILDAPRSGTRLSADEVEGILLRFGGWVRS